MKTLEDIQATLQGLLPVLRERYHVDSLGVFGSYVRGDQTEESDLDVLVTFTKTPGMFAFVGLKLYLEKILGISVDLGMRDTLKSHLRLYVLQEVQFVDG